MTRLMKELKNRGIIFEADELMVMHGAEWDNDAELIDITDKVIIVGWYSAVVPSRFQLYDRHTFEFIGSQDMWLDDNPPFFGEGKMNPWSVDVAVDENPYEDYDPDFDPETNYDRFREI